MNNSGGSKWAYLSILFIVTFMLRFWQLNADYGFSDEKVYAGLGRLYFRYFFSPGAFFWQVGSEHPPIAKYIYGFASWLYPEGHYFSGRILSALMGAGSCILTVLVAEILINFPVGILAGFILSLLPYFIAHNRICGLETPSVFLLILTTWFLLKFREKKHLIFFFLSALVFGLFIGIRLNNILMTFPILYLILSCLGKEKSIYPDQSTTGIPQRILLVIVYFLCSGIIFYLSWPWIWFHPIKAILQSYFFNNPLGIGLGYSLAQKQSSPFFYFFLYFLVTTPGLILLNFFIGLYEGKKKLEKKHYLFLVLFFLSPFLLTFTSFRREGIRYVLTAYPAVAIIAAYGVYALQERLNQRCPTRFLTKKLGLLLICYLIIIYSLVHPYELEYYNECIGGSGTVYRHRWFQIGHWGSGITKGIHILDSLPEKNLTLDIRVLPFHEMPMFYRRDIVLQKIPQAEFCLINPEYEWFVLRPRELAGYEVFKTVNVLGAPLVKIYRKKSDRKTLLLPLESSRWKAESNVESARAIYAIDRDLTTRWSSLRAQEPGMYFQVDMNSTSDIQGIGLVTWTTPSASPVGYIIDISTDGKQWHRVTQNEKTSVSNIVLEIFFPNVSARFIRVTQTGTSELYGWVIHEFYIYPAK